MRIYDNAVPTTADEAHLRWPGFYGNPAIQALGEFPMWTITDPTDKKPCSFQAMSEGRTYINEKNNEEMFPGARLTKQRDQVTLGELVSRFPDASNNSFCLFGAEHGYIVIDIEKTATDETRERLLELQWVYAERSLSGTGIHLLVPYPAELFDEFENAAVKPAIKSPDNTWEVLVNHWVTFTRNVIEGVQPGTLPLDSVMRAMAEKANEPVKIMTFDDLPEIKPGMQAYLLMEYVKRNTFDGEYKPRIDGQDESAYDFGMAMYFMRNVQEILNKYKQQISATPEEVVAIVKILMDSSGKERSKWYEHSIHGVPYLIYTIQKAYAKTFAQFNDDANTDTAGDVA